ALVAGVIAILALVPIYAAASGNTFMISLFTRIVILAIAAVSLNLIMGFGGMVSFGHAAYLGIRGVSGGIFLQGRSEFGPVAMAAGSGGVGAVRGDGRRAVAAHARRLLHHDHAGVRADGLLRRDRARPLRRRRRHDHL